MTRKLLYLGFLLICSYYYFIVYSKTPHFNKVQKGKEKMVTKEEKSKAVTPNDNPSHPKAEAKPHTDAVIKPQIKMESETVIISLD
ncbi:chitin deacetylase [Streptococcus ictaluri]|nr:chitin deacetylase [Streptococcus ictaluri]